MAPCITPRVIDGLRAKYGDSDMVQGPPPRRSEAGHGGLLPPDAPPSPRVSENAVRSSIAIPEGMPPYAVGSSIQHRASAAVPTEVLNPAPLPVAATNPSPVATPPASSELSEPAVAPQPPGIMLRGVASPATASSKPPPMPRLPTMGKDALKLLEAEQNMKLELSSAQDASLAYMKDMLAREVFRDPTLSPSREFGGTVRMLRFLIAHTWKAETAWSEYLAALRFRKEHGMDAVRDRIVAANAGFFEEGSSELASIFNHPYAVRVHALQPRTFTFPPTAEGQHRLLLDRRGNLARCFHHVVS